VSKHERGGPPRGRGRSGKGNSGQRGRPRKKAPPPESTGQEARFLLRSKEAETRLRLELLNGEQVEGSIEYYDTHLIKIVRPDAPGLLLRKEHIRWIEELT
jgi:sRNA-binding regulator protein Hfq